MTAAIEIKGLKKTYAPDFEALKGIDLSIQKGDFFALLGPNGAGKSTTIGIICGLIKKSAGIVNIDGHNIDTHHDLAKQALGVVPQEFNFNIFEPCIQTLIHQAGYYGVPRDVAVPRAEELLKEMELWDKRNTPGGKLSGGLKRRLMIARALVHRPKILILDEPTAGVDIQLRRAMWSLLEKLNEAGMTIILTTHYLEEAEQLCRNLAIINQGELIEVGSKRDLLEKLKKESIICEIKETVPETLTLDGLETRVIDTNSIEVDLKNHQSISEVSQALSEKGLTVHRLKNKANRLEELFVNLVESK